MKLKSFCLTKLVIFCAVLSVFTNLMPSVYVRAETNKAEKMEEYMPPVPEGKKWKLGLFGFELGLFFPNPKSRFFHNPLR